MNRINHLKANIVDLASDYKFRGMTKYRAWDQFIIDRNLKPEVNAKEFYKIFSMVCASPIDFDSHEKPLDYKSTHYDSLRKLNCQITVGERGVFYIIWDDGRTGINPPSYPPEKDRFLVLPNMEEE